MTTTRTVAVKVEPEVGVGKTTIGGSAITVVAYIAAVLALREGDRSPETIALAIIGTLSLLAVIGGRFAQAVAAIKAMTPAPTPIVSELVAGPVDVDYRTAARLEERVVEAVARGFREEGAGTALRDRAAAKLAKAQDADGDKRDARWDEEEPVDDVEDLEGAVEPDRRA